MEAHAPQHWQLEMSGGAIITRPDGDESYFVARLVWTMTEESTVRFLLFLNEQEIPLVRVLGPTTPGMIAGAAIQAFQAFTELAT
jgi:hypothetical protein